MTVIRPNSISGVTSITALQNSIEFYKSDGSLSGANIDGISINTAGIITANTFYGNGSNLTGITGTTINNNANNRLITGSGTANTLEGEANLTWNGQTFEAYNASGPSYIAAKSNTNSGDYGIVQVQSGSTVRGRLVSDASVDAFRLDTAGRASAPITFHTGSSYAERLRIDSTGYVQTKSELWVGGSAPVLRWRDSTHGEKATARIDGSDLYFEVNNSERLRIDSGGRVTTPTQPMVGCRHFSQNGNNVFNDGNNIYALTFHTVDVNIGSHFNNTTGIFTCPVAGNYFISCNLNLRQNQSSWSSLYVLRKPSGGNFQKLSDNWATSAINNTWAPISASHLVSCGAGDELVMAYNSGYSAPNNSSASGGVSMTIFLFG